MAEVHRNGDSRACGASTVVTGQSFVFVNGQLWSVDGDPDSHGGGGLIPSIVNAIYINGKKVIVKGDHASADSLCEDFGPPHCDPFATTGDATITAS